MSDYGKRLEAAQKGEKIFEGRLCKHGHGARRYTSNGACVECIAARAEVRQNAIRDALREAEANEK
jgi:hypothetical protein